MAGQQSSSLQKPKLFLCMQHADFVLKNLQYQPPDDTVLISKMDNCMVHANREVLDTFSDYFKELKEAESYDIESGIDGATLKLIIDFMYSGKIELRSDNVDRILRAADALKISTLKVDCCDFIGEGIDITNWLSIASMAKQQQSADLHNKAFDFVLLHFEEVCKSKDFLTLTLEYLWDIISSDDLCVDSSETVKESLMAWCDYDKKNREDYGMKLLRKEISQKEKRTNKETLGVVSGQLTDNLNFRTFDSKLNRWSCVGLPPAPTLRGLYSATVINKKLIIAGGMHSDCDSKNVERLDLRTKEWTKLPPMQQARQTPGMAELNGDLYVIGGYSDSDTNWLCSAEKFDFRKCEWQEVAPMDFPQSYVKVTVLGDFLYAVGNGSHPIECYNPANNTWTQIALKNEKSTKFAIAGVGELLYAVGGLYNGQTSKTAERYNPSTERWTELRRGLKVAFRDLQCVSWKNRLVVYGGIEGDTLHHKKNLEEFNPEAETYEWKTLSPLLLDDIPLNYGSGSLLTFRY